MEKSDFSAAFAIQDNYLPGVCQLRKTYNSCMVALEELNLATTCLRELGAPKVMDISSYIVARPILAYLLDKFRVVVSDSMPYKKSQPILAAIDIPQKTMWITPAKIVDTLKVARRELLKHTVDAIEEAFIQNLSKFAPIEFVRSILANPDDITERLILADWCDENGKSDEAIQLRNGRNPFALENWRLIIRRGFWCKESVDQNAITRCMRIFMASEVAFQSEFDAVASLTGTTGSAFLFGGPNLDLALDYPGQKKST
jgi:uncharacterized protein (TIGR02996 family)